MKKIVAIVSFIGILLQTCSQVVIMASFYANQDYIAKNLCENRDKPQMHCEGKCCLKKKLAAQGKEHAPGINNQKFEILQLFCNSIYIHVPNRYSFVIAQKHYSYNELRTQSIALAIFHPPCV